MAPELNKQAVLEKVVDKLQADSTVAGLVPLRNIGANASAVNTISPSIEVTDGGDETVTEIRRRTVVNIFIRTNRPDINTSDELCSRIEDAVTNCLGLPANQTLDGEVSRFVELTSEPLAVEDNPTLRIHAIIAKYEVV